MKPHGSNCSQLKDLKILRHPGIPVRRSSSVSSQIQTLITATVLSTPAVVPANPRRQIFVRENGNSQVAGMVNASGNIISSSEQSIEQKRLLIRKQLVILLHAIICRRRDLMNAANGENVQQQPCNVPFCGLMKSVLLHLNSCKAGRSCLHTHCASSRQILIHWKYCVKTTCPVCVSLRTVVPTSLLQIFPNALCRAEVLQRIAREQEQQNANNNNNLGEDQAVPELLESEE